MSITGEGIELGHLSPSQPNRSGEPATEPKALAEALRRHRVVAIGLDRYRAASPGPLPEPLEAEAVRRRTLSSNLRETWQLVETAADELRLDLAAIKGYSTRGLYPAPEQRDLGDIDLMARDVDDAWRLAGWLRDKGFGWSEWELPWIKRDVETDRLYGQVAMWKFEDGIPIRVDVHFGGYSVRHCRLVPIEVNGTGLHVIDPVANLPMLLGNAAGDFYIRLKDVNDVIGMVRADPPLDWDRGLRVVAEHGLERFWNSLLEMVLESSALAPDEEKLVRGLRFDRRGTERVPFGQPHWRRRCRATVADAFRAGAPGGPAERLRLAWSAYRYYRRPLGIEPPSECRHGKGQVDALRRMRNDVCVRLVPTELLRELGGVEGDTRSDAVEESPIRGSAELTEVLAAGHTYLRSGPTLFALTIMEPLCEHQARQTWTDPTEHRAAAKD